MMGHRSWDVWVAEYSRSHQHPVNKALHLVGIPAIVISLALFALSPVVAGAGRLGLWLFAIGWLLQFAGHAIEGKPPEFFKDWRFLFVGLRWWVAKVRGRV